MTGDASLQRRPMRRIIDPLTRMGARIDARDGRPPLTIDGGVAARNYPRTRGAKRPGQERRSARRTSRVRPHPGRRTGADARPYGTCARGVRCDGRLATAPGSRSRVDSACAHRRCTVPGDISGAAFWAALAGGTPGSDHPHRRRRPESFAHRRSRRLSPRRRSGRFLQRRRARRRAGRAPLQLLVRRVRELHRRPDEVPLVIDEIPALAALAAMMPAGRTFTVRGAGELRVKESDRISSLAAASARWAPASRNTTTGSRSKRGR